MYSLNIIRFTTLLLIAILHNDASAIMGVSPVYKDAFHFVDAADEDTEYHYYAKDYLGNVRAVISAEGSIEKTSHYYPFGTLMATAEWQPELPSPNRYRFGAKELDRTAGLDLLDFHARQYDPLTARFYSPDRFSEKHYHLSPYAYCANNPLRFIDPTGEDVSVLIAPEGASGYGHMAAVIQDQNGKFYYISAGATESIGIVGIMSNCSVKGGMIIYELSGTKSMKEAVQTAMTVDNTNSSYIESATLKTSKDMDGNIYDSAIQKQHNLNNGNEKYRVLSNNCTDIIEDIIERGTGIDIPMGLSPSPNTNFKNILDNIDTIQSKLDTKK